MTVLLFMKSENEKKKPRLKELNENEENEHRREE